jgi:hypothetical protein
VSNNIKELLLQAQKRRLASSERQFMKKPSKVPALRRIDAIARRMAKQWVLDKDIRARVGEEEFAYRMFAGAARRGREIGRQEMKQLVQGARDL